MRILLLAALAFAVSGCALFRKQETRAAVGAGAAAPTETVSSARFTPAFDAGAPVALMPCRSKAQLGATCKRLTASHERRGDMPAGGKSDAFSDAMTVSLTQE